MGGDGSGPGEGGGIGGNGEYKEVPVSYKGATPAYVEKAMLSANNEEAFIFKLLMRQTR